MPVVMPSKYLEFLFKVGTVHILHAVDPLDTRTREDDSPRGRVY